MEISYLGSLLHSFQNQLSSSQFKVKYHNKDPIECQIQEVKSKGSYYFSEIDGWRSTTIFSFN